MDFFEFFSDDCLFKDKNRSGGCGRSKTNEAVNFILESREEHLMRAGYERGTHDIEINSKIE